LLDFHSIFLFCLRSYEYLSEKPNIPCVFLYGQSDDLKEIWQKNRQYALHFVRLLADIAIKCKLYNNFNFKAPAQSAVCRFFVLLLQPENFRSLKNSYESKETLGNPDDGNDTHCPRRNLCR
jgi:hypothetical protein